MKTTFGLLGFRRYRDPEMGTLLARINPEILFPGMGEEIRLPIAEERLEFDPELGGVMLEPLPETTALLALYAKRRSPRGT